MEAHVAEVRRDGPEKGSHVGLRHKLAVERGHEVVARPTEHYGVPDGDGERSQGGNESDDLTDALAVPHAAHLHGAAECAHRASAHSPTEGHFSNHARKAQQRHENEVRDEEGRAAQLSHAIGKQPDIGHAHGAANAGEDEARMCGPGIAATTARAARCARRSRTRLLTDLDGPRFLRNDVVVSCRHSVLLEFPCLPS